MKKPYLNRLDRILVRKGTSYGDMLMFGIAKMKLERAIYRCFKSIFKPFLK